MKFINKPGLLHAALLFAGLLAMPAWAQQEVSPDHFDDQPAAAQGRKHASTAHKATAAKSQHATAPVSAQAQPKAVETAVLKAEVGKAQASQNPR